MVWIVIISSESFWSKWLLVNSNLMFACLSGFSLGFTTGSRGNCQEGSLLFLCPLLMLLFPPAAKIAGIFAALLVKLFWVGPISGTDKLPSIHCRTFGWHWEILWLLYGTFHCGIYLVQNVKHWELPVQVYELPFAAVVVDWCAVAQVLERAYTCPVSGALALWGSQGTLFCCLCRWHEPLIFLMCSFLCFSAICLIRTHPAVLITWSPFPLQELLFVATRPREQLFPMSAAAVLPFAFWWTPLCSVLRSQGLLALQSWDNSTSGSVCQALGASPGPLWQCLSQRCSWHSVLWAPEQFMLRVTTWQGHHSLLIEAWQASLKNSFKCSLHKMEQPDTWDRYFLKH